MKALPLRLLPVLLPTLWLTLLPSGEPQGDAARAFREGRFADAHQAYLTAETALGDDAPVELLHNRALAALRAGRLQDAEWTIEKAVARGGPQFAPLRDFLFGNAAFARCTLAELQASGPEAEPFAFDIAIGHAEAARRSWQQAAMQRADWPEARRNVERVLQKLAELQQKKIAAQKRQAAKPKRDGSKPQPEPPPPAPPDPQQTPQPPEATSPDAQRTVLAPEMVLRLFDRLDQKEREKNALRAAEQQKSGQRAERDW